MIHLLPSSLLFGEAGVLSTGRNSPSGISLPGMFRPDAYHLLFGASRRIEPLPSAGAGSVGAYLSRMSRSALTALAPFGPGLQLGQCPVVLHEQHIATVIPDRPMGCCVDGGCGGKGLARLGEDERPYCQHLFWDGGLHFMSRRGKDHLLSISRAGFLRKSRRPRLVFQKPPGAFFRRRRAVSYLSSLFASGLHR